MPSLIVSDWCISLTRQDEEIYLDTVSVDVQNQSCLNLPEHASGDVCFDKIANHITASAIVSENYISYQNLPLSNHVLSIEQIFRRMKSDSMDWTRQFRQKILR